MQSLTIARRSFATANFPNGRRRFVHRDVSNSISQVNTIASSAKRKRKRCTRIVLTNILINSRAPAHPREPPKTKPGEPTMSDVQPGARCCCYCCCCARMECTNPSSIDIQICGPSTFANVPKNTPAMRIGRARARSCRTQLLGGTRPLELIAWRTLHVHSLSITLRNPHRDRSRKSGAVHRKCQCTLAGCRCVDVSMSLVSATPRRAHPLN